MNINLFSRFAKKESYLGIDIGTTSIKAVELKRGGRGPELVNYAFLETYGYLERSNTALQTSALKLYDKEAAEYLRLILKKARFQSRRAMASLPAFSAFTTLVDMPLLSEREIGQTLRFKAKQYIPLPAESVSIDWIKVREKDDERGNRVQQVFLVAVPNDYIRQYQNIFRLAGLDLMALEIDGFSLARILTADQSKPTLIIDIGSRSSVFLVAQSGRLQFISQSDFAGSSLTQSLASGLGINTRRAEELKKQKGLSGLGYGPEQELSTLLLPLLDVIISEAKRARASYESSYQQEVTSVVLAGGGANLPGMESYFKRELNIPVGKAQPFSAVSYSPKLEPLVSNMGSSFAVALGLAVKPLIE